MSDIGAPPELAWLPVDKLDVDHAYQRTLDTPASQRLIRRIAENFSWMRFQAILATPGTPGRWLVIDGQHRAAAARLRQIPHLPAVVIAEASVEEQAAAFVGANRDRVPVQAQALFHARLLAGDADAVTLQRLCDAAGIVLLRSNRAMNKTPAGHTPAVSRLLALLRIHGEADLGRSLQVVASVFGQIPGAYRSIIFEAAVRFIAGGGKYDALGAGLRRLGVDGIEKIAFGITPNSAIPLILRELNTSFRANPGDPALVSADTAGVDPGSRLAGGRTPASSPQGEDANVSAGVTAGRDRHHQIARPLKVGSLPAVPKGGGFQDDPRARADHGSREAISREAVFGRSITGSSL